MNLLANFLGWHWSITLEASPPTSSHCWHHRWFLLFTHLISFVSSMLFPPRYTIHLSDTCYIYPIVLFRLCSRKIRSSRIVASFYRSNFVSYFSPAVSRIDAVLYVSPSHSHVGISSGPLFSSKLSSLSVVSLSGGCFNSFDCFFISIDVIASAQFTKTRRYCLPCSM